VALLARGQIIVALMLLGAGCAKQQQGGFKPPPMPVETALVSQGAVADRFEAVGSIEAGEAIEVVAEIDAIVEALPFREGTAVAQGELLAQLDDAMLTAEMARAEALREQMRVTYERIQSVVEQGAGAPQDLDNALASLKVAEANLQVAQARLEKTRIEAPFPGIVQSLRIGGILRVLDFLELFGKTVHPNLDGVPIIREDVEDFRVIFLAHPMGFLELHELGVFVVADCAPIILGGIPPGEDDHDVFPSEVRQRHRPSLISRKGKVRHGVIHSHGPDGSRLLSPAHIRENDHESDDQHDYDQGNDD